MTVEEKNELRQLARAIEENNKALGKLELTLTQHMTSEQACAARVENLDRVVFRDSEPGKPGLKRRMDVVDDWKERSDFVTKGIWGGVLRKAGELALTAAVLGGLLFLQSHLSGQAKVYSEKAVEIIAPTPAK